MGDNSPPVFGLLWYTAGAFFLAGAALLWLSLEDVVLFQHKVIVGVCGALFGTFALLSIAEWIRPTGASAQSEPLSPSINGDCNIVGGQSNTTNCNFQKHPFGRAEQQYLIDHTSKRRKIVINTIPEGEEIAALIFAFLKDNGYQVDPINHMMMAAGPNGPPRGVNINNPPDLSLPTEIWVGY